LGLLPPPRAPVMLDSIIPVEVGDTLPVLRITGREEDAETIANQALATACILTDGHVSATAELMRWAEAQVAEDGGAMFGPLFDPPLGILSSSSSIVAWSIELRRERDPEPPEVTPEELAADVGPEVARARADAALEQLVEHGLAPDTELPLVFAPQLQTTVCGIAPECVTFVEEYWFLYSVRVAGAQMVGTSFEVAVDRDGELVGLTVYGVDIEVVGNAVAAVDEGDADRRFLELAQQQYPDFDVSIDTPGRVAYLVPFRGEPSVTEPVWYGAWNSSSPSGIIGRPQPSSVSLTDPDAPLVPREP
jgi:hypothetical protein